MDLRRAIRALAIAAWVGVGGCAAHRAGTPTSSPRTGRADDLLRSLMARCDRDGDGRVTVLDERVGDGPVRFVWTTTSGTTRVAQGPERVMRLSWRLAERIVHDRDARDDVPDAAFSEARGDEVRGWIARSWPLLTRRADRADDLLRALHAAWLQPRDGRAYVYVPADDPDVRAQLEPGLLQRSNGRAAVIALPRTLDASWYARLDRDFGLLYLPQPYLVPGGIFDQMFGWDSYFMARGAMADGQIDVAVGMVEDLAYQIEHYGKIGNSNLSHHRGRSQPPVFARMALAVYDAMPPGPRREALLRRAMQAGERELREVWQAPPRITDTGLSRYHDEATGRPPEIAAGQYRDWRDTEDFYQHQRAVRESGWDMTHRFGERGHLTLPVCLNALLFGYERDLAEMHRRLDGPDSPDAARWEAAATTRRARMDALMWDAARGLYLDVDLERRTRNPYETVASWYALWVGMASPAQARAIVSSMTRFESPGGLAVSSEASRRAAGGEDLQWDWPNGWAPHQIIAVEGLRRYGYTDDAVRVASHWVAMVLDEAGAYDGWIKEKYDVVSRTAAVPAAEYGNQGGDRGRLATYGVACRAQSAPRPIACVQLALDDARHPRAVGFGWTNASIALLLPTLPPAERAAVDRSR